MSYSVQQQLGRALGDQYGLDEEIPGGGMSYAFLGRDRVLYRDIIVKALRPALVEGTSPATFAREIRLAAALRNAHIAPVLVSGTTEAGVPYYAVPFVAGVTLRERLLQGPLPQDMAVRLLHDVADGLAYAHSHGIVHRNVKPENVVLSEGAAVVTDMGVTQAAARARIPVDSGARARLASRLGTPAYMAPEQIMDGDIDAQSDVYAWGVMAYEMLAGRHPYHEHDGAMSMMLAHLFESAAPLLEVAPAVRPSFAALVMQCLEKDPANRPAGARALLPVFRPTQAQPALEPPRRRNAKWREDWWRKDWWRAIWRRLPWQGVAMTAGAVVLLASVGAALLFRPRPMAAGAPAGSTAAVAVPKIAVLQFYDSNEDDSNEYELSGLTDEVASQLAHVAGLRVIPRSSIRAATSPSGHDAVESGRALGADWVLEGRVVRSSQRLKLSVFLTRVADGESVLRRDFDDDSSRIFPLVDAVARAATAALHVPSAATAWPDPVRGSTLEAHDFLMRARYAVRLNTAASIRQGIRLYERAIAVDSTYVPAWQELADCWHQMATDAMPARDALLAGSKAAKRAWLLDSTSATALASRAVSLFLHERDFVSSDRMFARALRLDSTLAKAPLYADLLLQQGRADSAVAIMARAVRLQPVSRYVVQIGPRVLTGTRQFALLRTVCSNAVQVDSAVYTADCLRAQLRLSGEWRTYEATCRPGDHLCLGVVLHAMGKQEEALIQSSRFAAAWREREDSTYVDPGLLAGWFAQMGDAPRAVQQLQAALASNSAYIARLRDPYYFSAIKGDPAFQSFVARVGLP